MLTKDSNILKNFISKNIKIQNSQEYKFLYNQLFNTSLIQDIFKLNHQFDNNEIKHKPSPFISTKDFHKIKKLTKKILFKIWIKDIIIQIHIFYKNHNIDSFMNELYHLLQFIISYTYHLINHKKIIVINYYLIDSKKSLQKNFKIPTIFNKEHVNSGSCHFTPKQNTIHIWRIEEILKVTLHELLHALELHHLFDNDEIIQYYQNKYNLLSDNININEAFTEIWANLLNCFWISQKSKKQNYHEFIKLITIEKEFCKFQSDKIFYTSDDFDQNHQIDINKHTNVFAYYIIRNELFSNLQKFLKICKLNNHYLFINNSQYTDFLKKLNKIKKNNKRFNRFNNDNFKLLTTRMSSIEYDLQF